jgi:hypothetical protein
MSRRFSERYRCTFCAKAIWGCRCRKNGVIEHDTRHLVLFPEGCLMVVKEKRLK